MKNYRGNMATIQWLETARALSGWLPLFDLDWSGQRGE